MSDFQVSKRNARRAVWAGVAFAFTLSASAALAQTAPLSYAVPDSGAWSDILKNNGKANNGKASTRSKATAERKKPAQRQAKARPAKTDDNVAARESFASAPPKTLNKTATKTPADVRIVSPDELNEIDQMAGQ